MGKAARSRERRRENPDKYDSPHQKAMDKMEMITLARRITSPEAFEHILSQVEGGPEMREAVRKMLAPHLPFSLKNRLRRGARKVLSFVRRED